MEGIDALVRRLRRAAETPPAETAAGKMEKYPPMKREGARSRQEREGAMPRGKAGPASWALEHGVRRPDRNLDAERAAPEREESGPVDGAADMALLDWPELAEVRTVRTGGDSPLSAPESRHKDWFPEAEGTGADWIQAGLVSTGLPPAGEHSWAERTDRLFRRDSRRYDGGFYLY